MLRLYFLRTWLFCVIKKREKQQGHRSKDSNKSKKHERIETTAVTNCVIMMVLTTSEYEYNEVLQHLPPRTNEI